MSNEKVLEEDENRFCKFLNKVNILFKGQVLDEGSIGKFDVYILPDKEFINSNSEKNVNLEEEFSKLETIDSVYIHFGYCSGLCKICPYPKMNEKEIAEKTLIKELIQNIKLIHGKKLKSLLFGGGTPNEIRIEIFNEIISEIKKCNLDEFEQVAIEIHPGLDYKKYIKLLTENFGHKKVHVSIGLQSTIDKKISKWRESKNNKPFLYNNKNVEKIIKNLHSLGIFQINIDLLLDSFEGWNNEKNGIKRLIGKGVTKFTLYPIYGKYMHGQTIQRWNVEELIKIRMESLKLFEEYNFYHAINPNYFVKRGSIANLESITQFDGRTLIAIGLGARGKIRLNNKDIIYENFRNVEKYKLNINKNLLPIKRVYQQDINLEISNEIRRLVFFNKKISHKIYKLLLDLSGVDKDKIISIFDNFFIKEGKGYALTNEAKLILDVIQGSIWKCVKSNFKNKK